MSLRNGVTAGEVIKLRMRRKRLHLRRGGGRFRGPCTLPQDPLLLQRTNDILICVQNGSGLKIKLFAMNHLVTKLEIG